MTRQSAARKLRQLSNLRDAKVACEMGARALERDPLVVGVGAFLAGLVVGMAAIWRLLGGN